MSSQSTTVDLVDKKIILELAANCRLPYRVLARKLGLTLKTIRTRVLKLVENGVIRRFVALPSPAVLDYELLWAILYTDGKSDGIDLLNRVGTHPNACMGYADACSGNVQVHLKYTNTKNLAAIREFLTSQPEVMDVELHTLLLEKQGTSEFTQADLKVLRALQNDARLPITDIAHHTKLSPRRIRKILQKMIGDGGSKPAHELHGSSVGDGRTLSAYVNFRIIYGLASSNLNECIIRIEHDDVSDSYYQIAKRLKQAYPWEYWFSLASATAPVSFHFFAFTHLRELSPILRHIRQEPSITLVKPWFVSHQQEFFNFTRLGLEELFQQAGL
jgi:DNA-binding Lrp family transcriptional regulator